MRAVSSTLTWSAATRGLERVLVEREQRRRRSRPAAVGVAVPVAVLLARGLLELREALEAERLREAHDGRARGVRAARELLGGLEGDLVEVVDDVLRDVLLGARELVEAGGDVGGEGLVALGGAGAWSRSLAWRPRSFDAAAPRLLPRNLPAHGAPPTRLDGLVLLAPPSTATSAASSSRPTARTLGASRDRRPLRAGQPLALAPRHAARDPLPDPPRPGQARALRARPRARRRRRPAARLADVRRVGGGRARRRRTAASCGSRSASATASACSPRRRTSSTSARPTTTRATEAGHPLRRSRRRDRVAARHRAALLRARPRRAAAGRDRRRAAVHAR